MSKHTHTKANTHKENILILYCITLEGRVVPHNSWRTGAGMGRTGKETGAGRGDGRWWREGLLAIGDAGQAAVLLMPDVHIFGRLQLEGLCIGNLMHNTAGK